MSKGIVVWFVIDSAGSLLHGSWQNAASNLLLLLLGLPPMVALGWSAGVAMPRPVAASASDDDLPERNR